MKTWAIGLLVLLMAGSVTGQSITKEERKSALKYISWSTKELKKSIKGLTESQWNFKTTEGSWSPQECLYHIAFSETALRGQLDKALASPSNPAAKNELKTTDDQVKSMITSRETRVKTAPPFEPQNTGFKTKDEAWEAFMAQRVKLVELVKTTDGDLRNQIVELPFAKMDAYQFILFIAGHTNRHTQQIDEVKMAAGYPKD